MVRESFRARGWQLLFGLIITVVAGAFGLGSLAARPVGATVVVDSVPEVSFPPGNFTVNESDSVGIAEVAISAPPPAGAEVVVSYLTVPGTATSGATGDYLDATGVITFTHSSPLTQTFEVEIRDDPVLNEPDETVNLILQLLTPTTATLGRNLAILVITDNDVTPPAQIIYFQPVLAPDLVTPQVPPIP